MILAFYPAIWSPVCGHQSALPARAYAESPPMVHKLIGISVDGVWCHTAVSNRQSSTSQPTPSLFPLPLTFVYLIGP